MVHGGWTGNAGVVGRRLDGQAFPALGAPAAKDCATSRRAHPPAESVGSLAALVARLIGPFHEVLPRRCAAVDYGTMAVAPGAGVPPDLQTNQPTRPGGPGSRQIW